MVQVMTNLTTRESARRERFEPVGSITATNVQKAIEQVQANIPAIATGTTQTITAASGVGVTTDIFIYFNRAGTIAFTLPDATAWLAANTIGVGLTLKDISGGASGNAITINRAGADTIDGANSFVINSDYGGVVLRPSAAGKWSIVG